MAPSACSFSSGDLISTLLRTIVGINLALHLTDIYSTLMKTAEALSIMAAVSEIIENEQRRNWEKLKVIFQILLITWPICVPFCICF